MKVKQLAVLALFLMLVGCSSPSKAATKTIDVPMDDVLNQSAITRDVTLAVGDTLKVSLGSNKAPRTAGRPIRKLVTPRC